MPPAKNYFARSLDPIRETAKHLAKACIGKRSVTNSSENFKNWIKKTQDNPYEEIYIDRIPSHLTSFRNFLFCVDDKGILCIFTATSSNEIEYKNNYKIPIPSLMSIAANLDYFGVTYSCFDKRYLKSKSVSQVVLFCLKETWMLFVSRPRNIFSWKMVSVCQSRLALR